jgi:hypothetical protein
VAGGSGFEAPDGSSCMLSTTNAAGPALAAAAPPNPPLTAGALPQHAGHVEAPNKGAPPAAGHAGRPGVEAGLSGAAEEAPKGRDATAPPPTPGTSKGGRPAGPPPALQPQPQPQPQPQQTRGLEGRAAAAVAKPPPLVAPQPPDARLARDQQRGSEADVRQPSTPQETDVCCPLAQQASLEAASAASSPGSLDAAAKGSRAASPDPAASPSSAAPPPPPPPRPAATARGSTTAPRPAATAAPRPQLGPQQGRDSSAARAGAAPPAVPPPHLPQHHYHQPSYHALEYALNAVPAGVVGTFFPVVRTRVGRRQSGARAVGRWGARRAQPQPLRSAPGASALVLTTTHPSPPTRDAPARQERPRPPPAGDQVNFAQRIMEICFSAATQWPMSLALQFVVDGAPRGDPVDVTVGRSICKSQVSGSRQVIYYVRNPPLLRLARSFDARTVGYRLAGPTTLEWHLSTAPTPPAPAAAPKAAARRKPAASGGRGSGPGAGGRGGPRGSEDGGAWLGGAAALQQQLLLLQQLAAGGAAGGPLPGGLSPAALQQQLASAPPALLSQLAAWLAAQPGALLGGAATAAAATAAAAAAAAVDPHTHRTKRRKQRRPSRAPFYGLSFAGLWHMLPCFRPAGCAAAGGASDASASGSGSDGDGDGDGDDDGERALGLAGRKRGLPSP